MQSLHTGREAVTSRMEWRKLSRMQRKKGDAGGEKAVKKEANKETQAGSG